MCTNYRTNFENQQENNRLRSGIVKNTEQFFFSSETSAASICEISAFDSFKSFGKKSEVLRFSSAAEQYIHARFPGQGDHRMNALYMEPIKS